jgi:hypothetical protein
MRPPPAGKRTVALRLAGEVRRRLESVERLLPVHLPGFGGVPAPEPAALTPAPEDAAARIDAARARLRATIEPPADETG